MCFFLGVPAFERRNILLRWVQTFPLLIAPSIYPRQELAGIVIVCSPEEPPQTSIWNVLKRVIQIALSVIPRTLNAQIGPQVFFPSLTLPAGAPHFPPPPTIPTSSILVVVLAFPSVALSPWHPSTSLFLRGSKDMHLPPPSEAVF
jgi:hypothetical protein